MEEKLLKLGRRALLCALCCGALCVGAGAKELDEADYYARSALTQRADAETVLLLYDQIGAGIEEMETQIDLGDGTVTVSGEQVRVAMEACQADHPEFFWLAGGYQHGASGTKGRVIPFYTMSEEEAAVAQKAFDAAAEVLLEGIDPEEMTELEMELAIHDRLVEAVTYEETDQSHNAYGAMVDGTAVCEGYTEAFQYLLAQVGIQSHKAVGRANGGPHAWNLVRIDGDYYYTDVTWDDAGDQLYYAYFNVTTAQLEEDHTIGGNEFDLPVCTATAANYFEVYGIKFSALNAEILGQMLRESGRGTMEVRVYADTEDPKEVWTWYQENIRAIAKAAGVTGRFSYGYSRSGREYKLQLEDLNATPVCPENAHVWDKGVTEKAATCTEQGGVKYTCTVCGEKKTEATDALGHAWDAGTLQGTEKVYTCERCKETKREDASALFAVSNIRFNQRGELQWDAPEAEGEFTYRVALHDKSGKLDLVTYTRELAVSALNVWIGQGFTADVEIGTVIDESVVTTAEKTLRVNAEHVQGETPAKVIFGSGESAVVSVSGLKADTVYALCFGKTQNLEEAWIIYCRSDDEGCIVWTCEEDQKAEMQELLESGYYTVYEFSKIKLNGEKLKYTVTNLGGWTLCTDPCEVSGHDWDEGVEREGEIVYTCGRCGAVRTETKAEEEKKPAISGSISGHKVKEGTTVQLKKNGQVVSETDDAQEDFSFDGVDSGTYDLVVKEPGCLTYTVKNIVVDGTDLDLPEIEPVAGDFSGDDRINLTDLAAFRADFGKRDGELSNTTCDIDGDGRVNLTDLAVFRQNFGKTAERDCTVDYSA